MADLTPRYTEEQMQAIFTRDLDQLCPEVWHKFFYRGTDLAERVQGMIDVLRKSEKDHVWVLGNLAEIGMIYLMSSYVPPEG